MSSAHEEKQFKCLICEKYHCRKNVLEKHNLDVHEMSTWKENSKNVQLMKKITLEREV